MQRLINARLIVGIGLTLVVTVVSLTFYSSWLGFGSLGVPILFAIAFYYVTSLVANFRKAYTKDTPSIAGIDNSAPSIKDSNIAGRDINIFNVPPSQTTLN